MALAYGLFIAITLMDLLRCMLAASTKDCPLRGVVDDYADAVVCDVLCHHVCHCHACYNINCAWLAFFMLGLIASSAFLL